MRDIVYSFNEQAAQAGVQAGQSLIQLGLGIKQQREASGAAQFKRDKKALCGRKPLIGFGKKFRKRKEEYNKCVADIVKSQNLKNAPTDYYEPPAEEKGFNMNYIYIGIGIVVLAGISLFIINKTNK